MTIETMAAIADFAAGSGSPPPEKLWLIYMGSGDTAWCSHPSDDDEPSVPYVRADVASQPAKAPTMDAVEAVEPLSDYDLARLKGYGTHYGLKLTRSEADGLFARLDAAEAALSAARPFIAAECAKAGWLACRKQVYALSEATIDECSAIAEADTEGKMGAYARGRKVEAKGIARALMALGPENCDELATAIKETIR